MGMITLRVSQEEEAVFKGYAGNRGMKLSQLFMESKPGPIEKEYDIQTHRENLAKKKQKKILDFDEAKGQWKGLKCF